MSGLGRAAKIHLVGTSGDIGSITPEGYQRNSSSKKRYYPLGKIRLSNTSYTTLTNAPCEAVQIRNLMGNGNVYVGGSGPYVAQPQIMHVIYETELFEMEVNNANEVSLIADNNNTDVIVSVLSNRDIPDIPISNPPILDTTPPTVASTFPATGATGIANNSAIYFLFSESIDVSTINTTNITVSPSFSYTVTQDSVNPLKVLVIPSSTLAFSTTFTITAGTGIKDLAGNFLVTPFSFSFTTAAAPPPPDTTPPTVISTNPANNATDISLSFSPAISFSEPMQLSTLTPSNFNVFKDSDNSIITVASVTVSADAKTATLTISSLAYSTKYRIEIPTNGVKDSDGGQGLVTKYITYFTTSAQFSNIVFQTTGNTEIALYNGNYIQTLEVVGTIKSYLYNQKIIKYTVSLKKVGSPTGTIYVGILDNNDNVVYTFVNSINASSLTTSYKQYTFTDTGNTKVLGVNYKMVMQYSSGDSSNYVNVKYASATNYNKPDSYLRLNVADVYFVDYTDSDVGAIMTSS